MTFFSAQAQAPVPEFSASAVSGCGPLTVHFNDLSTGSPLYWSWDFGNGLFSSQQNPATTYGTPGVYTVTLIVRNKNGSNAITKTDYINVYPYPTLDFSASPSIACAPANVGFTDLSTPGQGTIAARLWTFGDGASDNNNQATPTHVYTQTGYYTVGLKVTNSQGCANTISRSRYVRVVQGVVPNFDYTQTSASCSAPFDINFINQTSGPGNLTYSWTLGNGNTSTQTNPTAAYPTGNSYTIDLTGTSDLGCNATVSRTISFKGATPVIAAPDSACIDAPISFQNGSTPAPIASSWTFGDGSTANAANPSKSYGALNTYTVTLTNTYGSCTASTSKAIKIIGKTVASFGSDKNLACAAPFTIHFKDQTAGATGWQWNFGDGATSTEQNPAHTYQNTGQYDVTLSTTAPGCSASVDSIQYVQIIPPSATLRATANTGCTGIPLKPVIDFVTVDGIQSYQWTAPGATPSSSTAAAPAFTYAAAGDYDLTLAYTTKDGCTFTKTFTKGIHIGDRVDPVFAGTPLIVCPHQLVNFSSTSNPVDSWLWNFGDNVANTIGPNTQHAYRDTGYFNVILTVTHDGCRLTHTETKYIYVNAPIALFKYKIDCTTHLKVDFTDTSKLDPTKLAPAYKWDFGDPSHTTSTLQNPTFTYPTLTAYTVTLIVAVPGGCADTITKIIDLNPVTASFNVPDTVCRDASFTMTSTSTPAAFIDSLSWKVGVSGFTVPSSAIVFSTGIPDTGAYTIILKVVDRGGCPYLSPPKTVHVIGPTAKFTFGPGGCRNSPVAFTDASIPYPGYPIASWTFDFGDGKTQVYPANTPPFTHNYTDTGNYPVKLAIMDTRGCTDSFSVVQAASITSPHAGFFARDTVYCPNAPLPFTDSSQGGKLTYSWDFGDGSYVPGTPAATKKDTTHAYAVEGQYYSVKLIITDSSGCADSITRNRYIHIQSPIAAFTLQDSTAICSPLQTSFTPNGQYYDSLYWNFGDGTSSNLANTTHFYSGYNTYTAKLILKGAGGCLDSAARNVYIYNPNTTVFTYSPVRQCDSILADFTIIPPPYTKFTIYFADQTADSSQTNNFTHLYHGPATYSPLLSMQDSTGCIVSMGSVNGGITVLGAATFFSADNHNFCDSGTVNFTDYSFSNDGFASKVWDFGDGATVTNPSPSDPTHFYNRPGTLVPTLKIMTLSNCQASYSDTILVHPTPHPIITAPATLCIDQPIKFLGSVGMPGPDPSDTISWAWNFGNGQTAVIQSPLASYSRAGNYNISLRTSVKFGCSDTTGQVIAIHARPSVTGPPEVSIPVGFPVTLPFLYSTGIVSWAWTPSDNLSCADCSNPVATPTFPTRYTVLVTDSNNCSTRDSILVTTICNANNYFIPNTFSPNNDGVNDAFYPRGKSLYNIQSMRVFNRWGQMVFERKDFPANAAASGWDGNFNGRPAPADVYVYIIEVICDNAQVIPLKGDITLIR